jgi:hypothetical protein
MHVFSDQHLKKINFNYLNISKLQVPLLRATVWTQVWYKNLIFTGWMNQSIPILIL